jgi:geranylgeranyl diphosphate synthase type II
VTDLTSVLAPWRARVDDALATHLARFVDVDGTAAPVRLRQAMRHALLAGGKRLRPVVAIAVARAVRPEGQRANAALDAALPAALALELVHTYSLVHDDLPALDDDDLRRGQPTVHRAFDEATAILAGDGMLTDAWVILARAPKNAARQVEELALAAGSAGMVGGQHDDLQNEGRVVAAEGAVDSLRAVHRRKTGRLFAAAAATGALAVQDDPAVVFAARSYGAALGFAFQVQDDILDVEGDVEKAGKALGRDEKLDKLTYVRALGLPGARALAASAGDDAVRLARALGAAVPAAAAADVDVLVELARFAVSRNH